MSEQPRTIPLGFEPFTEEEMKARASAFAAHVRMRRSVRSFSDKAVPLEVVRHCVDAAGQAPSGANKQPWTFVLVTNAEVKREIRLAAEREEAAFYGGRASQKWLDDLEALGTGPEKPYLETAPVLIAVFAQKYGDEVSDRHYYVNESVGIAVGFLLAALHHAGLGTLTHTPAPMRFLTEILKRPKQEQAFVLIPVGYPAADCRVPDIQRKPFDDICIRVE